jgi:hypothetical protein
MPVLPCMCQSVYYRPEGAPQSNLVGGRTKYDTVLHYTLLLPDSFYGFEDKGWQQRQKQNPKATR